VTTPPARHVHVQQSGSGLTTLVIDRPPVNALGRDLVADLNTVMDWMGELADVELPRVVIVAAAGKVFCAGADLKERQSMSVEDVKRWVPQLSAVFTRLSTLPMPTIAVVQGVAAGGGMELADNPAGRGGQVRMWIPKTKQDVSEEAPAASSRNDSRKASL